jgi:rubrerythrin
MKTRHLFLAAGFLLAGMIWLGGLQAQETATVQTEKATTLDNLMAAFNGESNAHARYVDFAVKADNEGYPKVANLFRAAARAEEIHARTHAGVISKMGGAATADVKEPEVKSTKENLEAALAGETYERDEMYPKFLSEARAEKNSKAVRSFNFAKSAEADHAAFYKAALDNLDDGKSAAPGYYVCPVCGRTVSKLEGDKCPVCFTPTDNFEEIS